MNKSMLTLLILGNIICASAQLNFQFKLSNPGTGSSTTTNIGIYNNSSAQNDYSFKNLGTIDLTSLGVCEGSSFKMENLSYGNLNCSGSLSQSTRWDIKFGNITVNSDSALFTTTTVLFNEVFPNNGVMVNIPVGTGQPVGSNIVQYTICLAPRMSCAYFGIPGNSMSISCDRMLYFKILVKKAPTPYNNLSKCPNENVILNVPSGTTLSNWSPSNPTISSPSATTNYTYTMSNGACAANYAMTISVNQPIYELFSSSSMNICSNNLPIYSNFPVTDIYTSKIYINGQLVFDLYSQNMFLNPSFFDAQERLKLNNTGNYIIDFEYFKNGNYNSGTCTKQYTINISPLPSVLIKRPPVICAGSSLTIGPSSAAGLNYLWQPGGQTTSKITVSPSVSTTYTLTVTNASTGCSTTIPVQVNVNNGPSTSSLFQLTPLASGSISYLTATGTNPPASGDTEHWKVEAYNKTTGALLSGSTMEWTNVSTNKFMTYNYPSGPISDPNGGRFYFKSYMYKIYHWFSNSCGISSVTVISISQSGMIQETIQEFSPSFSLFDNDELTVSPNPSKGIFKIMLKDQKPEEIVILNAIGETIMKIDSKEGIIEVDLTDHPSGVYFVKALTENNVFTKKIIRE